MICTGTSAVCSFSVLLKRSSHMSRLSTNLGKVLSWKEKRTRYYFGRRVIFSQITACPQKAIVEGKIDDRLGENVGLKPFSKEMLYFFFNALDPYSIKSFANHFFLITLANSYLMQKFIVKTAVKCKLLSHVISLFWELIFIMKIICGR